MIKDASTTADIIKNLAINAYSASMPTGLYYGTVKKINPLEVEIDQKLTLTEKQLILSTLVQDFDVNMTVEHKTEEYDLTHKHSVTAVLPHGGTVSVNNTDGKHTHEYKGTKSFTTHLKLEVGEKVILLRVQGGQKFLLLDRIRESSNNQGSSNDDTNNNGSNNGSNDNTDNDITNNDGSNSGSGDSDDNTNTDLENPDSNDGNTGDVGDNNNNTDTENSTIDTIITASTLVTILSNLSNEEKQELGLIKLNDLPTTDTITNECCLPVIQNGETKKVALETLKNDFGALTDDSILNLNLTSLWNGTSSVNEQTLNLSQSYINFAFIIVEGCIYSNPNSQRSYLLIPTEKCNVNGGSNERDEFLIAGSTAETNRRIRFYFPTETTLKKLASDGTDSHKPVITNVWGLGTSKSSNPTQSLIYSTEETNTGKTWIDGKTIYRKVYQIENLPNSTYKDFDLAFTPGTIIKMCGVANNGVDYLPLPYVNPSDNKYSIRINIASNNKIRIGTETDRSAYKAFVIIEYTKTD